jgi:putative Holliday junction resolvase
VTAGGFLAIDYGDRKCGFAAADPLGIALTPLGAVRHEGSDATLFAHLERLLAERDVATLVVGLPLHADGSGGTRADVVQAFVVRLRERFPGLAVEVWNEHLSTKEAESRLREHGRRGRAIRDERDSWAALVLLEDWLRSRRLRG